MVLSQWWVRAGIQDFVTIIIIIVIIIIIANYIRDVTR
jgi:ABC-type microcin C transport system permease subunit YejE